MKYWVHKHAGGMVPYSFEFDTCTPVVQERLHGRGRRVSNTWIGLFRHMEITCNVTQVCLLQTNLIFMYVQCLSWVRA